MRTLTICGTPVSAFRIVLKTDPHPAERTAASFLSDVIRASCGVSLPVGTESEGPAIRIGTQPNTESVRWDGFRMRTDGADLYLDGNVPRGTLYAAYDFAERYLGYRMFAPDTEVFSQEGSAEIPAWTDRVDNPSFRDRRCDWVFHEKDPVFRAHSRLNTDPISGQPPIPDSLGGSAGLPFSGHTMASLCPGTRYYAEHPEYYALVDGERINCVDAKGPGQLCLTNPDVLRIVTENVLKQLRENPDLPFVEVSQNDNLNYCRCPACAAVDEEEGSHAGTLLRFVNAVAEAAEREFPGAVIRTFAYQYSAKPPKKTRARDNVLIRYCTFDACFRHAIDDPECPVNRENACREMREWGKICARMSVWDYLTNWYCLQTPYPNLVSLRENVRFFRDCGVIQVFEEDNSSREEGGIHPALKSYLVGKLLWNADMSEEEYSRHIDEFLAAYYGPGWRSVRRIIELEHETTANRCFGCQEPIDICYVDFFTDPPLPGYHTFQLAHYEAFAYQPVLPDHPLKEFAAHLEELYALLGEAEEKAETDLQREHLERSRFSLTYLDLFCTPHDRDAMTPAERGRHVRAVRRFYEQKKAFRAHYNLHTWIGRDE